MTKTKQELDDKTENKAPNSDEHKCDRYKTMLVMGDENAEKKENSMQLFVSR